MSNNLEGVMNVTLEKIRSIVDVNTIIGDPIVTGDITLIPVSKVSFGFGSGGSDFPTKAGDKCFAGGAGSGINIIPVCFLVVQDGDVRIININTANDSIDKAIALVPEVFDKIKSVIKSTKKSDNGDNQ